MTGTLTREEAQAIITALESHVIAHLTKAEEFLKAGDTGAADIYLTLAELYHAPMWHFSIDRSSALEQEIIDLQERMEKAATQVTA